MRTRYLSSCVTALAFLSLSLSAQMSPKPVPQDTVIKGGTIFTITHGTIQNGSIYIHDG